MRDGWYPALHALVRGRIQRELAGDPVAPGRGGGLWFHMASVGEVNGMVPFIRAFRERQEGVFWCSATTRTGLQRLREALQGLPEVEIFRFPLDHPPFLDTLFSMNPRLLALVETELWPGLLERVLTHRVPLVILNGRMRHRTFQLYRWIPAIRRGLQQVRRAYVQTQWDAYRFAMLGVPRDHIRVTGNWKRLFPNRPQNPLSLEALGLSERDRVMILASVRSGEYDLALRLIRQLHAHVPDVRFLLAPRHMDHLGSLFSRLDRMHIDYQRWSADPARWDTTVLVLDTLGELLRFFPIGYLAVVFGSFAPYGGHNLLEPVFAGVPVVFGPYVQNVRDLASRILARGAGLQVASDVELIRTLRDLLENPQRYQMLREAARGFPEAGEDRVNTLMHELKEIIRAVPTGYAH